MKRKLLSLLIISLFAPGAYAQTQALNYEAKEISTVLKVGGVDQAWARGITGQGAIIAVVDNGFDLTHKDFAGKILGSKNFISPGSAVTWGAHGTLMAGIAGANKDNNGSVGVAPDAKFLFAQVGQGGVSTSINFTAVKSAIDWASANGATVINLSSGSNFDNNFTAGIKQLSSSVPGVFRAPNSSLYSFNQADVQAFAVGTNRGSIIVAAAGNQGLGYAQFPGAFATQTDASGKLILGGRMIIVGATDSTGTVIAPFSNKAGHICTNISGTTCNDPYQVKDFFVVAPGMQVYGSAANQQGFKDSTGAINTSGSVPVSGTSPATAYVSGGIALMKQAWPQLRPEQLVAVVLNTAKDMGAKGVDEVYGHGMVDFNAATQPMGAVVLANKSVLNGSGPTGKTVTLAGTGMVSGGAASLSTSSVLKNTQVVDTIGRNYTVDLTRAMGYNNAMSYQYATPWMSMAGGNYRQITNPIGKNATLTVMASDYGAASQYEWQYSENSRTMFEVGTINERNGFLGTQGYGAMQLGGSNTVWFGGGVNHRIVGNTKLIGNYTMGFTRTTNSQDSMVQVGPTMISDSWKLGIAQDAILFDGKTKDTLSFAVAQPVAVRSGYATVSGVTGYSYSDNGDGTTSANPITQTERVNLSPKVREMDLVLGYNIAYSNVTSVGINIVRQFNAGGNPGLNGNGVAIMARSVF